MLLMHMAVAGAVVCMNSVAMGAGGLGLAPNPDQDAIAMAGIGLTGCAEVPRKDQVDGQVGQTIHGRSQAHPSRTRWRRFWVAVRRTAAYIRAFPEQTRSMVCGRTD
jgi:hypothetical protein